MTEPQMQILPVMLSPEDYQQMMGFLDQQPAAFSRGLMNFLERLQANAQAKVQAEIEATKAKSKKPAAKAGK